jgi:hypothetical protein
LIGILLELRVIVPNIPCVVVPFICTKIIHKYRLEIQCCCSLNCYQCKPPFSYLWCVAVPKVSLISRVAVPKILTSELRVLQSLKLLPVRSRDCHHQPRGIVLQSLKLVPVRNRWKCGNAITDDVLQSLCQRSVS